MTLQVMKNIGLGGHESEVDFFRRLYRVFDTDRNGQVDFEELYTGLSMLLAGSARVKLQMFFDMFFTEERQSAGLSKFNVYRLFMAMLQFFGSPSEQQNDVSAMSPMTRERSCEWTQVFRNIDINHDGVVSFEELYHHVLAHPELCSFLDSAVLRFGAEIQYTSDAPETEAAPAAVGGPQSTSSASSSTSTSSRSSNRRKQKSSGLAGITERGSAAFNRALRQSALTNKVANRRTSYSKPWQQQDGKQLMKTLPAARRSSSDPTSENQPHAARSGAAAAAAAAADGSFLPRVSSSQSNEEIEQASSRVKRTGSNTSQTSQLSSGLDLRLERSDSANSAEWSTEGTPPGSPSEQHPELMLDRASVRSGANSVRERPINDSPSTWLLKNKKARQFVTASKSSSSLVGGEGGNSLQIGAGSSSMYSLFR